MKTSLHLAAPGTPATAAANTAKPTVRKATAAVANPHVNTSKAATSTHPTAIRSLSILTFPSRPLSSPPPPTSAPQSHTSTPSTACRERTTTPPPLNQPRTTSAAAFYTAVARPSLAHPWVQFPIPASPALGSTRRMSTRRP